MRNLSKITLLITLLSFLFEGCSSKFNSIDKKRDLIGVAAKKKGKARTPYGMVYINSGSFIAGSSDDNNNDIPFSQKKKLEVSGFFMDQTEISNSQYRQFVNWLKDSLKTENIQQLNYTFQVYDYETILSENNTNEKNMVLSKTVNIYPDTLVWIKNFPNSEMTFLSRDYFSSGQYDDYPVVGISWEQAKAFCDWRTHYYNKNAKPDESRLTFDLPSEWQWEYAARGGLEQMPYPWGGFDLVDSKGRYRANYKTASGDYSKDGGTYTVPVQEYTPNNFMLYNMSGNVAEWTNSSYGEAKTINVLNELNPSYTNFDNSQNRKTIRGGSWKDFAINILISSRSGFDKNKSTSYIGFRTIASYPQNH